MKQNAETVWISPLVGTERAFFEGRKEELRTGYEASLQRLVDTWEASATTVAALTKKRSRHIRFVTFFGTVILRCREGVGGDGHWRCPALTYLGLSPYQRYSPDIERRMAVLAAETLSYEKASGVGDEAAWFSFSDNAVHAAIMRLGEVAQTAPPKGRCAGAAGPEDTLICERHFGMYLIQPI